MNNDRNSQNRLALSIALVLAALGATFAMSLAANQKSEFWSVSHPVSIGTTLDSSDLVATSVFLGSSEGSYISSKENPVGTIVLRTMQKGELLERSALSRSRDQRTHQEVSLSIRAVDMPESARVGEDVDIYQLHDAKSGETAKDSTEILTGVFISAINHKGNNFGGEVALTVSVDRDDVPRLLVATMSGRLAIVRDHG
jgi:hypothetical protein